MIHASSNLVQPRLTVQASGLLAQRTPDAKAGVCYQLARPPLQIGMWYAWHGLEQALREAERWEQQRDALPKLNIQHNGRELQPEPLLRNGDRVLIAPEPVIVAWLKKQAEARGAPRSKGSSLWHDGGVPQHAESAKSGVEVPSLALEASHRPVAHASLGLYRACVPPACVSLRATLGE